MELVQTGAKRDLQVIELVQTDAKLAHCGHFFLKQLFTFDFILGAIHVLHWHVKTCNGIKMRLCIKRLFETIKQNLLDIGIKIFRRNQAIGRSLCDIDAALNQGRRLWKPFNPLFPKRHQQAQLARLHQLAPQG